MSKVLFGFLISVLVSIQVLAQVDALNKLVTGYTEQVKRLDAYAAPYFNVEEDLGKFGDYLKPELKVKQRNLVEQTLKELKTIDKSKLDESYQITYDLFKEDLETVLGGFDFPYEALTVDNKWTRLTEYLESSSPSLTSFPFSTVKHYEAYVSRAAGFPAYIDRQIKALRDGLQKKVVLSCPIAEKVPGTYKDGLVKDVEKNPFYRPISMMPKEFSKSEKDKIQASFKTMIATHIVPSFERFDAFFQKEYLPKCRKDFGYGTLPNGKKWYRYFVKLNTNTNKTPEEIHKIGLAEVARIRGEMIKIKDKMGFKGDFKAFLKFIVDDPNSYFKTPKEAIESYNTVRKKIDAEIPKYFNLQPKADYQVVEAENGDAPAASYNVPTELKNYGRFVVNTINLKGNSILEMTSLSLHEAVPGHHFQLALAFELKDKITEYQRKIFYSNAFVEGWALYTEYLGREMGLFTDDKQYLGHLSSEMLRAVRLVLDTGIHSKGWTRQQSIDYMAANLASDIKDVESEVERYSVWPGQALGYKIGQLKIIELRKKAEKELKNQFDIKKFHDVVLGQGTLSLFVLEKRVNKWIQEQKKGKTISKI
ncbi:MAG: DUF885 domain-containing protein [Bdellovibrionaceae bacterium]|nr:DUF885 domain-containing protein [Pseudobdellovibrionaceae bacterium]